MGRVMSVNEKVSLIESLAVETGRPIDLIDLYTVGEPLLGQILRNGKRIMGENDDFAALIRRHVFDQADFVPYINRILKERREACPQTGQGHRCSRYYYAESNARCTIMR